MRKFKVEIGLFEELRFGSCPDKIETVMFPMGDFELTNLINKFRDDNIGSVTTFNLIHSQRADLSHLKKINEVANKLSHFDDSDDKLYFSSNVLDLQMYSEGEELIEALNKIESIECFDPLLGERHIAKELLFRTHNVNMDKLPEHLIESINMEDYLNGYSDEVAYEYSIEDNRMYYYFY